MSAQGWAETLAGLQVDGPALTNTVTPTSLLGSTTAGAAAKATLPAGFFTPGKVVRVNAWGRISNLASATLTLDLRFGSVIAWNGGSMATNATAKTNVSFRLIAMLTCRTIGGGTTATMFGMGDFCSEVVVGSVAGVANDLMLPASAPAAGNGFDSSVAQTVDLFGTWGAASATNTVTVHEYTLESLN